MKRVALYSQSRPAERAAVRPQGPQERVASAAGQAPAPESAGASAPRRAGWRRLAARYDRPLLVLAGALLMGLALVGLQRSGPQRVVLTQKDIDKAVLHTLNTKVLPSPAAKAAERVRPAVVRVRGVEPGSRPGGLPGVSSACAASFQSATVTCGVPRISATVSPRRPTI